MIITDWNPQAPLTINTGIYILFYPKYQNPIRYA